jgi:hypothetical protein
MTESHTTAIRMEVLAMLNDNKPLETLSMSSIYTRFQDYLVFVAAIQPNTKLKSLRLHQPHAEDSCGDDDKTNDLIPVLKKNYGLEELPGLHHGAGDICSIFELSRISKGVAVLSRANNDVNSVFLHLLENPRLCDQSAVEMSNIGNLDKARSTRPRNHSGKSGGKQE